MLANNKKFNIKITAVFFILFTAVIFIFPFIVSAQQVDPGLTEVEQELGPAVDIRIIIARIIRIALGILGALALIIVLYGGFVWMTAGGNEEKISQAKRILINGGIGLAIILSAFAIASFILSSLQQATGGGVPGDGEVDGGGTGGTLGYGIIESHYPMRGARSIPRNTKIVVTFKEAMDISSVIDGVSEPLSPGELNTENFRILTLDADMEDGPFVSAQATASEDERTFVIDPADLLGSASQNISYRVYLTDGIQKADGEEAFTFSDDCEGSRGYCWDFEVSTIIDNTPPRITGVFPVSGDASAENPRNAIVQINFSEAIDPLSASGHLNADGSGFNNIIMQLQEDNAYIPGSFRISNQYRTVEFLSDNLCGENSCGNDVYCLPGDSFIEPTVKAASLGDEPPQALLPFDGVADLAGNSLDGGSIPGQAEGPPADNYSWSFYISDFIDLTPPAIEEIRHTLRDNNVSVVPAEDSLPASMVSLSAPLEVIFNKVMMFSTINNSNIRILSEAPEWYGWFEPGGENFVAAEPSVQCASDSDCGEVFPICKENICVKGGQSSVVIRHSSFFENTQYVPEINSAVKDIYQNCFYNDEIGRPEGPEPSGIERAVWY